MLTLFSTLFTQFQGLFVMAASYGDTFIKVHCGGGSFFGFPMWYKYLSPPVDGSGKLLNIKGDVFDPNANVPVNCTPVLSGINDFWLIGLAVVEILLRVAVLVAIFFVMFGGFKYVAARGQDGSGGTPDKLNTAKLTIYDALTGLVIAIVASAVVSYIAGRFSQT